MGLSLHLEPANSIRGSVLPFRAIAAAPRSDSQLSAQTIYLSTALGDEVNAIEKASKTMKPPNLQSRFLRKLFHGMIADFIRWAVIAGLVLRPNAASPVAGHDDDDTFVGHGRGSEAT